MKGKGPKLPAHEERMPEARKLVQENARASINFLCKELQISTRVGNKILVHLEAEGIIRRCTPSEKSMNSPWEVVEEKILGMAKEDREKAKTEAEEREAQTKIETKRRRDALKVVYKDLLTEQEERKLGTVKGGLLLDMIASVEMTEREQMRAVAALQDPDFHAAYHRLLRFELELSLPKVYRTTRKLAELGDRESRKQFLELIGKRPAGGIFAETPEKPRELEEMTEEELDAEIRRRARTAQVPGVKVDEEKPKP